MAPLLKRCGHCKQRKSLDAFSYHKNTKDGLKDRCKTCENASAKIYRATPQVKTRQESYQQVYRAAHSEQRMVYQQAYRAAHPGQTNAYQKAHRTAHPEQVSASKKAYRAEHLEQEKARKKAYHAAHLEQAKTQKNRRRARKSGAAVNDFTHAQWMTLQAAFDHRCAYCGKRAKGKLTQDHITPVTQHGPYTLHNIVPACKSCNSKKHTGPPLSPVQPLML